MAEMNRSTLENFDIEFEDVKFLRATSVTKNQEISLYVLIQKGTGRFEIIEGKSALVNGYVRVLTGELTALEKPKSDPTCPTLTTKDFYKELRLRGYHYSGLFRSVVNATTDGRTGQVKWHSNWIAFLDCLLQMQIIAQDTRSLMLPTGIERIAIKANQHLAIVDALEDQEKILDVIAYPELDVLRCGGIEMRGLQASTVGRRRPPDSPVLEAYQFVPHMTSPPFSKADMARIFVQLALENIPMVKLSIVEVDEDDGSEPLVEFFDQALSDLPLVTGDLNYLSAKQNVEMEKVNVQDGSLSSFNNVTFIIKSFDLSDEILVESITSSISDGGFVVSRHKTSSCDDLLIKLMPNGFQVISVIKTDDGESIVLFQFNKTPPTIASKVVKITADNYDWLDELKQSISKCPVIAYSEREKHSGIIGLVNCIRKEPNGLSLKCVFIDDHRAPPFDVDHPFYKSQLKQGLAINVFRNGHWGSFRHTLLQQNKVAMKRIDHCYANCITRGDLSSITWLTYGASADDMSNKKMVRIKYASLNFRDVMLATGKLMIEATEIERLRQLRVLGFEYSGLTEDNKRVMGMAPSAIASHTEANDTHMWICPDEWSLEEAATVPAVYATVYQAFFVTIKIERGKSILIHAGSGGIGLAAIHVAFAYGLDVFTTVSTQEKRNYLLDEFPLLKKENIGNSRDTSFKDMVLMRTNGRGVDYVLNSLAGEKLLASIKCLAKGGSFLEIGKFDLANDTKIGLRSFLQELSFHVVQLDPHFQGFTEDKMVRNKLET